MKIQLNTIGLLLVLSLILAFFYVGKGLGLRKGESAYIELYDAYNRSSETIKSDSIKIDSITEYVSQLEYVRIDNDRIIKNLKEERERLSKLHIKNVKVIADLNTQVSVLNKRLESESPAVIITNNCDSLDNNKYLKLPVRLSFSDKWAFNNVIIPESGEMTTDFGLYPSEIKIILGEQKEKWYKDRVSVIAVTNPNPYHNISPSQVTVVEPKKKWYKRGVVWFVGGLIGGLAF